MHAGFALLFAPSIAFATLPGSEVAPAPMCPWTPPSLEFVLHQPILVVLRAEKHQVERLEQRYPIAAAFVAVLSWNRDHSNVFDAARMSVGFRHQPGPGTASWMFEGNQAELPAFAIELPEFQYVLVEANGWRISPDTMMLRLLATRESTAGKQYIEGPVDLILHDTGERYTVPRTEPAQMAAVMRFGVAGLSP